MKILNFGSLNLDFVYSVDHIVAPGETISSKSLEVFCGGKGLNQSVALAKAGAKVFHAGMVGPDGAALLETCRENGIDSGCILEVAERSGNAIIQVSSAGQNSIVLFGGANQRNTRENVDAVLSRFDAGDLVLLQNEINLLDYIIDRAADRGMRVVLNPSPFDEKIRACDLRKVGVFLVNEIEGEQITGEKDPDAILRVMREKYPDAAIVLTLGGDGAVYQDRNECVREAARKVKVVDTTAAGDTFAGYFLAGLVNGDPAGLALRRASFAAGIAVSRMGASVSIPLMEEVAAGFAG